MIIQIFGTMKCRETQKAVRFLKERRIKFQLVDLNIKGISRGEMKSITKTIPVEELIDKEGREFKNRNFHYIKYNAEEALLEYPLLLKTPVLRNNNESVVGFNAAVLGKWIKQSSC
jgi:arsenate reductase